ncbi:DNA-binding transcriptional regulator, XRE-family HTH domain [Cruoricaptor ignavus]|uniref:DNA-binding transcriptional regulator, XRE-family HTH domain n=1 Tax=Cruoricaptor ignavus TaxID=1118202 RepID=A0A1M6AZ48_9FLAO|nr:helix-turn-helix transcriptional regulator [Cruoricaptor ignavus]SHI41707.1 DNA-binding transcriptional regulator, XRE-family HTH domain [Cruoricaptor ignavus]
MENTLKNLRQLIRLYRLKKGYSQEVMGELLGISQSAYANIENGKNKITVDKLLEIMRLLDKISFWV